MGMGMGSFLGMVTGGSVRSERHVRCGAEGIEQQGTDQATTVAEGDEVRRRRFAEPVAGIRVKENGVNGKVKMSVKMDACPMPWQGDRRDRVDSQMSVSGKPGTGGHVKSHSNTSAISTTMRD